MASSFSLPSESVSSFSLPQLKWSNTSDKAATTSASGFHRPSRIVLKFSSQGKNMTDDVVSSVADQTLVGKYGEELAKDETKEAEKRKPAWPTFLVSHAKEKIEDDLLAIGVSKRSKRPASRQKKRTTSFQNNLSSFVADNCLESLGSRSKLAEETSENEVISSDGGRKIMRKFSTASDNKKHAVDQNQTLVSTEFEEVEKSESWKNKKQVSEAVNQTLVAPQRVDCESTHLGIAPLIKENGKKKKRTFSTFSVSLTREQIEADFLTMEESMRTRRIKKRPKNVQLQLDDLFPGLRLKYITRDDYKVCEDKS